MTASENELTDSEKERRRLRRLYLSSAVFALLFIVLALLCLRQWNTPAPWSRVDVFSGGALGISVLMGIEQVIGFNRAVLRTKEVMQEALGMTYDPALQFWAMVVGLAELSVFLDYGHWHLVPALEQFALQTVGLGLYLFALGWIIWTDRYLSRHFSGSMENRSLIQQGPYRAVRHPRYLGLLVSRAAFALTFASILAWFFVLGWVALVLRRIRREEEHMKKLFPAEYEAYQSRTARLLPGVY